MLRSLSIRDIVLIEALDLDFSAGLNVLTGETGAGKSILLDALGFALGRRVRRNLVRAGAAQGSVTAEFDLQPGAYMVHVGEHAVPVRVQRGVATQAIQAAVEQVSYACGIHLELRRDLAWW